MSKTTKAASSVVRALVGARVSNVRGSEKTSHIAQRSKGKAYAETQDWTVVGVFGDLDVSAIKLSPWARPDLKAWLVGRAEEWDALIFAKTDQVFRSAADCVKLAEWCREHGRILVLVDDGIKLDYYHPEDAKDAFAGAMSKVDAGCESRLDRSRDGSDLLRGVANGDTEGTSETAHRCRCAFGCAPSERLWN